MPGRNSTLPQRVRPLDSPFQSPWLRGTTLPRQTSGIGSAQKPSAVNDSNEPKRLRHAVFFYFKEESKVDDIQSVVDAFRALPAKIPEIVEFQSGLNNSLEGKDDGFTHCFLLSFDDESGRETYLPHPAHKGDFADVLRPHMKDVFVLDYWGKPYEPLQKELKHAVFFKFKDGTSAADVKKVEDAFVALEGSIGSIKHFEWGINNSPETHDDGFTHCFMLTFESYQGRAEYLPHPDHQAFVKVLVPHLDKVRVLDFWGERVN